MKRSLKADIKLLISLAKEKGLSVVDVENAEEYLAYFEYGLCFDTVITQLHEYDIEIDHSFYELCLNIANRMDIPESEIIYLKELILSSHPSSQ